MKVKKIHIENYRMLKRIDIDLEENLSLIIGKNNCGKTSFLSILNKFIGSQSSTNNFTYNDFNSDFQVSLFDAINDDQPSWEKLNIKGIELYLFIEYDETDNLSNIQPLMLDLDPDNNIVIEYLFNRNVDAMLTPAQKRSYPNILRRTQKLFYVCCTRAKDNLVVYYPSPSDEVLEGAVSLFGRDNCIDLDAE